MFLIDYKKAGTTHTVHTPFDSDRAVTSGAYHRETNTIGSLTFTVLPGHPVSRLFEEMAGVVTLFWNTTVLFKARIVKIKRDLYNRRTIQCEGLLGYLNDSIVGHYTFNENSWLYPLTTQNHNCTIVEFLRELITLHNNQVTTGQRFTFVDETNGAFDDTMFTVKQDSYVTSWSELESKVLRNIGGYIQIRYSGSGNQIVYKAELTEQNPKPIRFAVNLKNLEQETGSGVFATAIYPYSKYVDANGREQDCTLTANYVEDSTAVAKFGRLIKFVEYEGVSSAAWLEYYARRDLSKYTARTRAIRVSATDIAVSDPSARPLEIDKLTTIISTVNGVNASLPLNAFDVDIVNPLNSQYRFNSEIPYGFKR